MLLILIVLSLKSINNYVILEQKIGLQKQSYLTYFILLIFLISRDNYNYLFMNISQIMSLNNYLLIHL